MADKRLDVWIPEELKAYLAERAERENRGMNLIIADLIRREQAREQGTIIEQQSLPVIREIVSSELRQQLAQQRSNFREDMALELTSELKEITRKSDNRLAALIIRTVRDSAIVRRMVYVVLSKAHGPEFALKAYENAKENAGKELAKRPARESTEEES